ncbi:MAG: host attachment protein [Bdellovibrionales bacterium]|nr:host attachment protein [Bdellovibrionales bacterium]
MPNKNAWILVADESHAKVFRLISLTQGVKFVKGLEFPEGRDKIHEFTVERPTLKGYTRTHQHTTGTEVDIERQLAQRFSKAIADVLEKSRCKSDFESLILVAPPKFLGELRNSLTEETKKLVHGSLNKEMTLSTESEIFSAVKDLL